MRPRTFILIIVIILVLAIAGVLTVLLLRPDTTTTTNNNTSVVDANTNTGNGENGGQEAIATEPGVPPPSPTPSLQLVVITKARIPVGTRLTEELLTTQQRPSSNIALQGGYTFSDVADVVGTITRVEIPRGEAVLKPMVALDAVSLASLGSDLALYVDRGEVAVAFPITRFSGAALALRPGDHVDVLMSIGAIAIDTEFRTALQNNSERIDDISLLAGTAFLLSKTAQGRLELVPEVNQVAEIVPLPYHATGGVPDEPVPQIPKRVTQLTIQQAEVLWLGTWVDRAQLEKAEPPVPTVDPNSGIGLGGGDSASAESTPSAPDASANTSASTGPGGPTPTPLPQRFVDNPDVVVLSMSAQDALALKWALERGVDIDLALRAQGDLSQFVTTSVSLPQIVEQGGVLIPEVLDFDLAVHPNDVTPPSIPPQPTDTTQSPGTGAITP